MIGRSVDRWLPEGKRQVLDPVDRGDASGVAQCRQVEASRREADHPLVVGDAHEQGAVGVALAEDGVDLEGRPPGIGRVTAVAVVHDAFEDGECDDPHGTILAVDDPELVERLDSTGAEIVDRVSIALPEWVVRSTERIFSAWGRLDEDDARRVERELPVLGPAVRERVAADLVELFSGDPAVQSTTPLAVLRSAYREPTVFITGFGVPEVVRDPFDERTFPADIYDLAPKAAGDIGDADLGPVFLAWGLTKAKLLRARAFLAE